MTTQQLADKLGALYTYLQDRQRETEGSAFSDEEWPARRQLLLAMTDDLDARLREAGHRLEQYGWTTRTPDCSWKRLGADALGPVRGAKGSGKDD